MKSLNALAIQGIHERKGNQQETQRTPTIYWGLPFCGEPTNKVVFIFTFIFGCGDGVSIVLWGSKRTSQGTPADFGVPCCVANLLVCVLKLNHACWGLPNFETDFEKPQCRSFLRQVRTRWLEGGPAVGRAQETERARARLEHPEKLPVVQFPLKPILFYRTGSKAIGTWFHF